MKFKKTISFNCYEIGDRAMEDVIFFVDLEITDDDKIVATSVVPDIDCIPYMEKLGGKGCPDHWQKEVTAYFEDEAIAAEALGEAMTEDEFAEFEHALMGGPM